jgi:hypothetical protein
MEGALAIVLILALFAAVYTPAFLVARQSGVSHAWVAYIPLVGMWVTILRAAKLSPWLVLVVWIPLVGIFIALAVAWHLPKDHERSQWWFVVNLIPVIGWYAYALTLKREGREAQPVLEMA